MKMAVRLIISIIVLVALSISGCVTGVRYDISYKALYEEPLNHTVIIQVLQRENVYYEWVTSYSLHISFGKGVNNDSLEKTGGGITNGDEDDYSYVGIDLADTSKYPPVKEKEELESRKPFLEESMDYITSLVYEATGMQPVSKEFVILNKD